MATRGVTTSGPRRKGGPSSQTSFSRSGRGGSSVGRGSGTRPVSPLKGMYSNENMVHSVTSMMGLVVDLTMANGKVYEGILRAMSPQMEVVLELAYLKTPGCDSLPPPSKIINSLQVKWKDVVSISSVNKGAVQHGSKDIFKTDDEISGIANGHTIAHKLQPFEFEGAGTEELEGLEESVTSGKGSTQWSAEEMFTTNKEKFNIRSTFDEEMSEYTTKLDRNHTEEYLQREKRAELLASQIESQDKSRHDITDDGTEEEMFSAVVRDTDGAPGQSASTVTTTTTTTASTATATTATESADLTAAEKPVSSELSEEGKRGEETTQEENKMVDNETSVASTLTDSERGEGGGEEEGGEGGGGGGGSDEHELAEKPNEDTEKKEEAIRSFQLNPHAKEFNPAALSSLPTSVPSSVSSGSVGSMSSQSSSSLLHPLASGRPRSFNNKTSPRNSRGMAAPTVINTGGLYTPPDQQPPTSFITTPFVQRPLQSPGQLHSAPVLTNQYPPMATTIPSPTGMVVRPQANYPQLVGQVQQQLSQQSQLSIHPTLQQPSTFFLPSVSQSHLLTQPMFPAQPMFLIPPASQGGVGGSYSPQLAALHGLQGMPFNQSQGGGGGGGVGK